MKIRKSLLLYITLILFVTILLPMVITVFLSGLYQAEEPKEEPLSGLVVNVYVTSEEKIVPMDLEEYIKGVVAAEMPVTFHEEALKAQAVAARTYTLRKMLSKGGSGCKDHEGADVCTDTHCQAYLDEAALKKNWGTWNYLKNFKKIEKAVEETKGESLRYEGNYIEALFHSTSGGRTENAEDYFETALPYLRSVESPYEENSPYLQKTREIKGVEFIQTLKENRKNFKIELKSLNDQIKVMEKTEGGKIKKIQIGNTVFTGREIRSYFDLPSSGFDIQVKNDKIKIITRGFGHGVGMSQYGAFGYAKRGWTYDQILKHYYTGVEIVKE